VGSFYPVRNKTPLLCSVGSRLEQFPRGFLTGFIATFVAIFSWWAATLFSIEEENQILYLSVSRMGPQFTHSENISSWKIYSDNKIGFEFQIPPDSMIDPQDASRINFKVISGTTLSEKYLLVQTTENTGSCEKNASGIIQKKEAVAIHGLQFTKYTASDAAMGNVYKTTAFITEKYGKCIILSFVFHSVNPGMLNNPPPPFDSEEEYKVVEQVLNTFGFTFDTSNWKTYRDEKYGFELQYPPDWHIEERSSGIIVTNKIDGCVRNANILTGCGEIYITREDGNGNEWIAQYRTKQGSRFENILIDGSSTQMLRPFYDGEALVIIEKKGYIYRVEYLHGVDNEFTQSNAQKLFQEFKSFLATLKFFEPKTQ